MNNIQKYLDAPGINFSTLKYVHTSPKHYRWAVDVGRPDTTALMKFRAIHTAILEPDVFDDRYVVYPGKTRRGKEWDAFCIAHPGCEIIKADERDKILKAAEAVMADEVASPLFDEGEGERALTWFDPRTGLQCKARVDWWSPKVLLDVKSGPVNDRIFGMLAAKLLYYVQIAWYSDGLMAVTDFRPPAKFVVVEDDDPFDVFVVPVDDDQLQLGRDTYAGWLDTVLECQQTGKWPGRYTKEQPLLLPKHVYYDDDIEDGTSQVVVDQGDDQDVT